MNQKKLKTVSSLVGTAMLSAVAFALMFLEFPIPIMPSFICLDLSDLPAILGAFCYGPISGIVIELLKNLLHIVIKGTQTGGVGELSNFILGAVFAFTAGMIYRKKRTKKWAFLGGLIGAVIMGIISVPSNYFVVYPIYYNFISEEVILGMYQAILPPVQNIFQALLIFNLPFTIVKGLLSVGVTMLIYQPLRPILKMTFLAEKKSS